MSPTPSDDELFDAWCAGRDDAANVLLGRYYTSVFRFFELRTRGAADLTQRTFLACVEHRERIRSGMTFRAFLFSVARHQLYNALRDTRVSDRFNHELDGTQPDAVTSVSTLVARREEQQILLTALAGLSEELQTTLVLHYWEGMHAREIAQVLEVATSTITTRLHRARAKLADRIQRQAGMGRVATALQADLDTWLHSFAAAEPPVNLPGSASLTARLPLPPKR